MKFFRFLYHILNYLLTVMKSFPKTFSISNGMSYYPEKERKPFIVRLFDNFNWLFKYGEINTYYTLYGLDIKGSSNKDLIDYKSFMISRNKRNKFLKLDSQIILLRDKFLFFKYMESNHLPVPSVFAIMKSGKLYDTEFNEILFEDIKDYNNFFVKDIDGECASFVKRFTDINELINNKEILSKLSTGMYIFQEAILQNDNLSLLNSNALNTLRIITINRNGKPYVLSALLRVGTSQTGNVDNWAAGGLAIGINDDGFLKQYGYYKPCYGGKTDIHPDTNIKFSEFNIIDYERAKNIACEAHKRFYNIRAIGWDVALTSNGPVFIEGNDNFEITLNQACDRPLKTDWLHAME